MAIDIDFILAHMDRVLADGFIAELPGHSRGKVRDSYDLPDGRRIMVATDRQSAFDQVLAAVPFKGQVLNQTARFWFEATRHLCPNHIIDYPDPNVVVCRRVAMLPVEIVVRDYLTGSTGTSVWTLYRDGARDIYGHRFPDGMRKNQPLAGTIITPTTKAGPGDHDRPITAREIVDQGLLTPQVWETVEAYALAVFAHGKRIAADNGLILVDTKYEFGMDEDGRIVLADEIHTPDSSRFWRADSYAGRFARGEEPEALDKEFLRLWISGRCDPYRDPIPEIPAEVIAEFSLKYIALFTTITGQAFEPGDLTRPIIERIRASLAPYMAG
jgi:phosphoribosylaminoimidazole-succinocarboxamide synthase